MQKREISRGWHLCNKGGRENRVVGWKWVGRKDEKKKRKREKRLNLRKIENREVGKRG